MIDAIESNPCPTPPVCEFGEYGCEAEYWGIDHDWVEWGGSKCGRCGTWKDPWGMVQDRCNYGQGGRYGMCDRMGQRPEVDTVNVVPCS